MRLRRYRYTIKVGAIDATPYRCISTMVLNGDEYEMAESTVDSETGVMLAGAIGNESVPIQLAQCWFPGLAVCNAKISIYFSNKINGNNFIQQHLETVMV